MERLSSRDAAIALVVVAVVVATLVVAGMWSDGDGGDEIPLAQRAAVKRPDDRPAPPRSDRVPDPDHLPDPDPGAPLANLSTRLRSHIDSLASAGGSYSRVVFTEGNRWSVAYVLRQMRRSVRDVSADTFLVKRRSGGESPLVNAVAMIPGASDSLLVICAHIDASASRDAGWNRNWSRMRAPGADDDGTGIAAMLETLTLVAHSGAKPRYTLMFVACNAEERNPDYAGLARRDGHHLGSRHLAGKVKGMGRPVKGVIAMDMVGWNPREEFIYLFASQKGSALARELVAERDRQEMSLGLPSRFAPCPNSDNESFDRFGIPAVLFMESCAPWRSDAHHPRNPVYHTHGDTPAMITYPILDKVTRLVSAYVMSQ